MANELRVWLSSQPVGTLSLEAGVLSFRYDSDWAGKPDALALSRSLPLQLEPFDDHRCRPFFAGLLPEGNLRRLIAQRYKVSTQNDFRLLDAIGGECAGAITFTPVDQRILETSDSEIEWLIPSQLAALLKELPRRPMLAGREGLRLSLAGAQDKLPVCFDGARVGLPKGSTPSTHILKPAIPAVTDSVVNESFCLALASVAGLAAAQATIFSSREGSVLLVTRYDRRVSKGGQLVRIHQEDFCQALGVAPEMKYQNEGGPDLQACFELLRGTTRPIAPQLIRLLDAVIFNALIGNHDAHAKNFSLLYEGATPTLAPLYDVLSTAIYENLTDKMAMKIGGKYRFTEIQGRHWERFAQEAGSSVAQTKRRILRLAEEIPAAARNLQRDALYSDQPVVEKIVSLIEHRSALTIRRLTATT